MPENDGTDEAENTENSTTEAATRASEKSFSQSELDRIVADRISREKAKYADYADLKKKAAASMSENERAVAEAEQRGRSAALATAGVRLARAEFKAAAAGKVPTESVDGFLEYADLGRFVGEDGEPDLKAISAAIKKLSGGRESAGANTDYDGGARTTAAKPNDMNARIRQQAGLA